MKRSLVYCFLVAVFAFSSCQKAPDTRKSALHINIKTDPQSLDPRIARDLNAVTLCHMLFEGLTRTAKDGSTELAIADRVEISSNNSVYTFHLRNTKWSNGDLLTSEDFVRSWTTLLDPNFPSDLAYQLYVIKGARQAKMGEKIQIGVTAPNSSTLTIELEQPTPYFLELLTMPSFFPVHHRIDQEMPNWAASPETLVCNGPFVLKSWNHADSMELDKNLNYWESERVKIDEIDLYMVSDDTEMRLFEDQKLDWAGSPLSNLPVDAVASLKKSGDLQVSPLSGTYLLRVNTQKGPLANAKFRKALAMAVDREAISTHIMQGGHAPGKSLVPPEMGLEVALREDHALAAITLDEALKELSLERKTLSPIVISYSNSERNASIVQAIQKQWEDNLKIRVELEAVELKTYYQRVSQRDFQLAAGSWIADFNDPINFLEVFKYKDGSTNNTGWENSKYIELLNQSALCREMRERKKLLSEAESLLLEEMPMIPVFHFAMNYLKRNDLKDVVVSPIGQIDFRWAELEPSKTSPSMR